MWAFKANISANETGSTFTLQVVLRSLYIYMHVANSLHWGKHFALMYIWFTMLHSMLIIIYPWNMNITFNNNVSHHKNEFLGMLLGIRHICNFLVDWNVPHESHYLFNEKNLLWGHGTQEPLFCEYAPPPKTLQQSLAENVWPISFTQIPLLLFW